MCRCSTYNNYKGQEEHSPILLSDFHILHEIAHWSTEHGPGKCKHDYCRS